MHNKIIISADSPNSNNFLELWKYRELFYTLAWRDFLVRYKQTFIGILWGVIRPLLTMLIMTFVFGKLCKLDDGSSSYLIIVFCGTLPWHFFSAAIGESCNCLVNNSNLVSKIYFPRLIIPASSILVSFLDFMISSILLSFIFIYLKITPSLNIIYLPFLLIILISLTSGIGFWISALNVKYRDFRHVVPFLLQFGLFISPVGFKSSIVPETYKIFFYFNPLVGIIEAFRWMLVKNYPFDQTSILISIAMSLLILVLGHGYFKSVESEFADVI